MISMGSLFDDLKQGLEEAIEYEKGQGKARVKTYMIMPVKEYSNTEIREIRMRAGMTQGVFASYMGVSKKTVEAWDQKWICIGDKPVTAYMMLSARKDSLVYTVPVTLNNEPCDLIIKYDNIKKSGSIYGARQTSNQLIPGKGMLEIKDNDAITFRYEQFDDNDSINYIQSTDTIIVQQDRSNLSVKTTTVPKGKYRYGYCLVDLYGRKYYTKFTDYDVK